MAAPTLNVTRPYGSISGDALGRMYEQDNLYFMADGSVWVEPAAEPEPDAPAAKPASKQAVIAKKGKAEPLAQDAQLDAQLGGA